jgi:hypothetical protein
MKKIGFWTACIAVITLLFSCSKQADQLFQPLSSHSFKVNKATAESDRKVVAGFQHQQNTIVSVDQDTIPMLGGGEDDDKPIIMHFVRNEHGEPLGNALITMINNTDSLQSFTNSTGESSSILPHGGTWQLVITLSGFSPLTTQVVVTDSLSVITSIMQDQ